MKIGKAILALTLSALVMVPALALANTNAKITILHGIRGQDLGAAAELPVDVYVNDQLTLEDFKFSDQVTVNLPAGAYDIDITLANDPNPVISVDDLPIHRRERATIIAHLNAAGVPTASKFLAMLTSAPWNSSFGQFGHTAAAPAVDAFFSFNGRSFFPFVRRLVNGRSQGVFLNPRHTVVAVTAANTLNVVLGPANLTPLLAPRKAYQFFVVGSLNGAAGNSLTVLRVEL